MLAEQAALASSKAAVLVRVAFFDHSTEAAGVPIGNPVLLAAASLQDYSSSRHGAYVAVYNYCCVAE